jgi:hypothetical protein
MKQNNTEMEIDQIWKHLSEQKLEHILKGSNDGV